MGVDKTSNEWLFFRRHGSCLRKKRFLRDSYRNRIMTEDSAYPGFAKNLRELALEILTEKENFSVTDLQTALSVLTVTGTKDDITSIKSIDEIGSEELSIDVRTCVYEIKHAK